MNRNVDKKSFFVLLGKFASRRGLSRKDRAFFYTLIFLFVTSLDVLNVSYISAFKQALKQLVTPIKLIANNLIEIPKIISSYVAIKKENEQLRLELDGLKINTIISSRAEQELRDLKKLINLKYTAESFEFMEKVIGFDKTIYDSFVLISANHPVTKPNSIVSSSDGLVGIIFDCSGKIARVLPITNNRASIPTKTKAGEHVILSGSGHEEMFSKEIQSNSVSNLTVGDVLYTSGEGGIYPGDVPVAKIISINKEKNSVKAKPIVRLENLSFVFVSKPIIEK